MDHSETFQKIFQWAVGVLGTLVTAAVIYLFSFFYTFSERVETIAQKVHDNGGVTSTEIKEINSLLSNIDARIEAGEADRGQIRQDIRQIVDILSR
jgi:hypothetical protein